MFAGVCVSVFNCVSFATRCVCVIKQWEQLNDDSVTVFSLEKLRARDCAIFNCAFVSFGIQFTNYDKKIRHKIVIPWKSKYVNKNAKRKFIGKK